MVRVFACSLVLTASLAWPARAEPPVAAAPETASPEEEPPATWRFRKQDRPVKVVVLAGSVGAFPRNAYADLIGKSCRNVEVKNLSRTGFGAYQLRKHFTKQVIENRYVNTRRDGGDFWLVFQGGLNSVADPERTNHHIRTLFRLAHKHGMRVVGLSPTPWGAESDKRRWAGLAGLAYWRHTHEVVDYLAGRSSPEQALGKHVNRRDVDPGAPWQPEEVADVGIDLYDSALRDRDADVRSVEAMRELLRRDRAWQRRHKDLSETQRGEALERDARAAAELPRWYLRPELRGFDHIHPNERGHRAMFDVMCPSLPSSWGCACKPVGTDSR